MTTKVITKELNLLDIGDIEQAISEYLERDVSIFEAGCTLVREFQDESTGDPRGSFLRFEVGDDSFESFDVFDDEHEWNGKTLSLEEPWVPVEYIFNFDVSAFKSFDTFCGA